MPQSARGGLGPLRKANQRRLFRVEFLEEKDPVHAATMSNDRCASESRSPEQKTSPARPRHTTPSPRNTAWHMK